MARGNRRHHPVGVTLCRRDSGMLQRTELYDDVAGLARAEGGPWRPVTPWADDPRLKPDASRDDVVSFSVIEVAGGTLIGSANLWGIDTHNAH